MTPTAKHKKAMTGLFQRAKAHVGHTVTLKKSGDSSAMSGKVLRATLEERFGMLRIFYWLDATPFPEKIDMFQVYSCSCDGEL